MTSESCSNLYFKCNIVIFRFAHVISYDYFEDLLAVLQRLLKETELQERQYLLLISTVLTVLNGQGTALTLDPTVFQKHLYVSMKNLGSGLNFEFYYNFKLEFCVGGVDDQFF